MPADTLIVIPTTMPRDWSWLEEFHDELVSRGILSRVRERTKWPGRLDKHMIHDILTWRCWWGGHSICPAVAFENDKAYLLVLDDKEDKFVRVLNFEDVMVEEIKGLIRYSECLEKYGYDYPC
jgi:hypothetical protein